MIHFDLPKQKSSIIKVLGVGGGGSNAVNFMFADNIEGVDFIICNTDAKALEQSKVMNKIQLGPHLTQGLGAGANPEVGKQATEESLEEIKRILEVNTKMAFICAGMGGGTGTGGAPIIAKICRELGILTVGIVTTPFGFEGPRRQLQAEEGIRHLEPLVDTLLVISNDKLRVQYGNLKMKEAFGKADNVLATAAKCITDIINSRGHIIVDFADVCTVMKNGGVAILGSSAVEGEDRAQRAIEEALNSPLLNDNDIRGAKWILININSAEGDHECTMDELEIINNHLRLQAGENTDVIVGMGYDNSLNKKIGITLVATGFEHKDPFAKPVVAEKKVEVKEEKIVLALAVENEEKKEEKKKYNQSPLPFEDKDPYAPKLSEPEPAQVSVIQIVEENILEMPVINLMEQPEKTSFSFELKMEPTVPLPEEIKEEVVTEMKLVEKTPEVSQAVPPINFLSKPSNIYSDNFPKPEINIPVFNEIKIEVAEKKETEKLPEIKAEETELQLVMKEETHVIAQTDVHIDLSNDDDENQRRRAADRIQKLRNLSFNMNTTDASGEFDAVPAYVRRNMELFGNTLTSVENFYSKYTVKKDENDETQISTINTFLDGKKPD
jgi:cell division protein FtsZ